ncbi:MAG: helix-turn-helix domain-containing protein [Acidaminococcaceae bacterium]|nr:helix-turn-helix domain-containing protein [Acidaminococcaceae bacterium]
MCYDEKYDMLSVEELMEILHLGKNTAYELLKSNTIKCFRIRGRYKIPKISVYEYIENQRNSFA